MDVKEEEEMLALLGTVPIRDQGADHLVSHQLKYVGYPHPMSNVSMPYGQYWCPSHAVSPNVPRVHGESTHAYSSHLSHCLYITGTA